MAAPANVLYFHHPHHAPVFAVYPNGLVRHLLGAEAKAYGGPAFAPIEDEADYQNFLALAEAAQGGTQIVGR